VTEPKKNISIIYYQKNDSPKYLEINKKKFILFLVGLPTLTLFALTLGMLGLIQTSPFHLLDMYRQNTKARLVIATGQNLQTQLENLRITNKTLEQQVASLQQQPSKALPPSSPESAAAGLPLQNGLKCPAPTVCKPTMNSLPSVSIGLSTLSFFKPIQGQKDKTHPASLNLTGFKTTSTKDNLNLQFNIINLLGGDIKLAGHIVVLMKNDFAIQIYPPQALLVNDFQINYASGEPFATQRFRPVDASFVHPRKSGNYMFTVFIFSKTGDLIHYQNILLPVRS
jgi:hypothetical protein